MYQEVLNYLTEKICDLGFERKEIVEDSYLRSDLGLDSSEVVDISLQIKKDYGKDVSLKDDMKIREVVNKIMEEN